MTPDETLYERSLAVLNEQIRPLLHIHGGEARIAAVDAEAGIVDLELLGACACCQLAPWTYAAVLRTRMTQIDGVNDIRVQGINVSQVALDRVAKMFPVKEKTA
ncbi:NifU family protein [Actinoplanes bogorensis]|uniref:NifU family protein n=1 Tax=Paractinoplanes bogorensis TaxID=1610840 RepID=A0ABS5YUP7_9ACTN|nr:NifU family protein [Actinoplanes bogorensis]MBU2667179.1 NifU family protein [Actinoplanes bogorensis]